MVAAFEQIRTAGMSPTWCSIFVTTAAALFLAMPVRLHDRGTGARCRAERSRGSVQQQAHVDRSRHGRRPYAHAVLQRRRARPTAADAESFARLRADGLERRARPASRSSTACAAWRRGHSGRLDDLRQALWVLSGRQLRHDLFYDPVQGVNAAGFGELWRRLFAEQHFGCRRATSCRVALSRRLHVAPLGDPTRICFADGARSHRVGQSLPRARPASKPPDSRSPSTAPRAKKPTAVVAKPPWLMNRILEAL